MEIVQTKTPERVCEYLKDLEGRTAVHAGGTGLLVQMRTGKIKLDYIIDLSKVEELKQARRLEDGKLWIGAMVIKYCVFTSGNSNQLRGTVRGALPNWIHAYRSIGNQFAAHDWVNHNHKEYALGDIHTIPHNPLVLYWNELNKGYFIILALNILSVIFTELSFVGIIESHS